MVLCLKRVLSSTPMFTTSNVWNYFLEVSVSWNKWKNWKLIYPEKSEKNGGFCDFFTYILISYDHNCHPQIVGGHIYTKFTHVLIKKGESQVKFLLRFTTNLSFIIIPHVCVYVHDVLSVNCENATANNEYYYSIIIIIIFVVFDQMPFIAICNNICNTLWLSSSTWFLLTW